MVTLVDGTVPVAADFNNNFTALNQVCGTTTSYTGYTTGDVIYASSATALAKLGIGKAGQGIGVSSGLPAYGHHIAGHIFGLTLSNNAGDATNDIDIAIGEAVSGDTTFTTRVVMALTTALTKQLDAAWAVGTNAGMLDSGAIANGTYHIWLIMRSDTGVVDILASTSATAPTMPTNYDKKRRIGAILRESAAIVSFTQDGDEFLRKAVVSDIAANNPGNTAVLRTLSIPTGVKLGAIFNVNMDAASATNYGLYISSPDVTDEAVAFAPPIVSLTYNQNSDEIAHIRGVRTNTSAQIRTRCDSSDASLTLRIATLGWLDPRGRTS
jgi:hypothetical protein